MRRTRRDYLAPVDEKTTGARQREMRKRRGPTQGELADKLDIRQSLISGDESSSFRTHSTLEQNDLLPERQKQQRLGTIDAVLKNAAVG